MFNLSTGVVIQDVAVDGFKDMYITGVGVRGCVGAWVRGCG